MSGGTERFLLHVSEVYCLAVLRPLAAEIHRQGGETAWFFDGPGAQWLRPGETRLVRLEDVRRFDPLAVFIPGNSVPDFFPGIKVEVFHGFSVGKRSDERGHFRIRGWFDLYCTHGSTTTARFRELADEHGHFRVVETGWPKMDPLFPDAAPLGKPWRDGWDRDRPLILLTSTFTPSLSAAPALLDQVTRLSREDRWNWLVTLHPKMSQKTVRAYRALESPSLRFVETDDILPLLAAADVMVSDTSSVVHEFLLLHKPVVTLRNTRPGPHLIDIREPADLAIAIETALRRPDKLMRAVTAFAESVHPYRDGRSSERVLAATRGFAMYQRGRLRPKPLNLWRKIKLRRRLGYWHWR